MYLGYVISGDELKIITTIMDAIMKWLMPPIVFEVMIFVGETQYFEEIYSFIFSSAEPLLAITISCKCF